MKTNDNTRKIKMTIALCAFLLAIFCYSNTLISAKATDTYNISVYADYIKCGTNSYDGDGNRGEFSPQCQFGSSVYHCDQVYLYAGESWDGYRLIKATQLQATDKINFRVKEVDPWPNPDDIVVSWTSQIEVGDLGVGTHILKYYDDASTGFYIKYAVVIST